MKPILFNTDMVCAILAGRKTQTRRIIKGIGDHDVHRSGAFPGAAVPKFGIELDNRNVIVSPYQVGDILYVRETLAKVYGKGIYYAADYNEYDVLEADSGNVSVSKNMVKWHPSIHMPKEVARIFLYITNVKAQRLQDANEDDIEDEGYDGCQNEHTVYFPEGGAEPCCNLDGCPCNYWYCSHSLAEGFGRDVWDPMIKPADLEHYGWNANPWVWVYTFERISKEEATK